VTQYLILYLHKPYSVLNILPYQCNISLTLQMSMVHFNINNE